VTTDGSTADALAKAWTQFEDEQRATLGEHAGFAVLGTRPAGSWSVTHVRLSFARGEVLLDYLWNDEKLIGVQFGSFPGYSVFRPTGTRAFASFDLVKGMSVELTFDNDLSLRMAAQGRAVVARRE
jgi:hypothetical protein